MSEAYQPIDCALHSELEVAAEHHRPVTLRLRSGDTVDGVIEDVWTQDHAEYLRFRNNDESISTMRLDELDTFWPDAKRNEAASQQAGQTGA